MKSQNWTDSTDSPDRIRSGIRRIAGLNLYQKTEQGLNTLRAIPQGMPKTHPEGRIIDVKYRGLTLEKLLQSIAKSDLLTENKAFLTRFITDAALGKTILKGQKKKIEVPRLWKYYQDLKKLDRYFQKPLDQLTETDMERFVLALESGELKSERGTPFSKETQVCIKKILIKFYKWLFGECRVVPPIVSWIDTTYKIRDYRALKKEQVETILTLMNSRKSCDLLRNRAFVLVLFDVGPRIDELLNVRLENVSFENGNYKIRLPISKTKPRTVTAPLCKAVLDLWLDKHPGRADKQAQLFPLSYQQAMKIVSRAGELIGAKLTPHGLRHSSVTYYARTLSRYQLCYRYGWAMSSKQPDRYICQEGLEEEKVSEIVEGDKVLKLTRENSDLNQRLAILEEQFQRLREEDRNELKRIIELVKSQ